MKKLLLTAGLFFLPWVAHAGTITTSFSPLGTITIASGTAAGGGGTGGTYTYIQTARSNANTYTNTLAFGAGITAHSTLIIGCTASKSGNYLAITDNNSNTAYSTATFINSTNNTVGTGIYYTPNANAGATSVTCVDTTHTATWVQLELSEYGTTAGGTFDVAVASAPATSVTVNSSGNMSTTVNNEFVYSFVSDYGSALTSESGTLRDSYANNVYMATQDTVVSSASPYASTFTCASGSKSSTLQAAFK